MQAHKHLTAIHNIGQGLDHDIVCKTLYMYVKHFAIYGRAIGGDLIYWKPGAGILKSRGKHLTS
jgi:hypothetical protein